MKKLLIITLALSLLTTSPAFAYEVKSGDTMGEIAKEQGLSLQELAELNPEVENLDLIFIGQDVRTDQTEKATQPVQAVKPVQEVKQSKAVTYSGSVSAHEVDLMARLVRAEAQGESYAGKVAVADVILNRVASGQFPNSISGVVYQGGQFSPVSNGSINKPADAESIRAVKEALSMGRSESLFFYNAKTATSRWLDSRPTVKVIGNHTFKR